MSLPEDFSFEDAFIYCADGGINHALRLGIVPDAVVGDFDTYKDKIPFECEIIRCRAEKDETDTYIAAADALKRGFCEIHILAALGARFDHAYANIQTLFYIFSCGAAGFIEDEQNIITMQLPGQRLYPKRSGYYFSLFSYTPEVRDLTIKGTKYEAENITLKSFFPLGVSNEINKDFAAVTSAEGILLVIYSRDM